MRYLLIGLLAVCLLVNACSKKEVKSDAETRLSVEPSGWFYLNLMPPIPKEGPNLNAVFRVRVINVGKALVKNVELLSAEIFKVSDGEEQKLVRMELEASPGTPEENDILPGEEANIEYGGSVSGATYITPGLELYAKVFVVWEGGDTTAVTPTEEIIVTR